MACTGQIWRHPRHSTHLCCHIGKPSGLCIFPLGQILSHKPQDVHFPLSHWNNSSIFYAAEYLTYLFADELIFTNENQRRIMINQFPEELQKFIMQKSVIEMHPTLDAEYYQLKNVDLTLDDGCINIAYFGRDYYGQRHFESLFYSMESLNHEFKDKLKIHIFIEDVGLIEKLISPLQSRNNFIVRKPLKYFDFLNASTQFDVLIVSDVTTRGVWPFNPYLPSKLSDYLGSKTDIWALCEKGSTLSYFDLNISRILLILMIAGVN